MPKPALKSMSSAKVADMAANIRRLITLKGEQAVMQAELIRWCVATLRRGAPSTTYMTPSERRNSAIEHSDQREKALLYLDWLATRLEDQK